MNVENNELPRGWESATLAEVCQVERGITFPASAKANQASEGFIACLRTANVQRLVDWDDPMYVPKSYVKNENKLLRQHDILISMANSRELVGKVSFIDYLPVESTLGGFISAIRAFSLIEPKFLFYYFCASTIQNMLRDSASQTVNIANLSLDGIYSIPLPLPPLPEQQRIVAAIEQQFTRLDAAVAALKRAQIKLKRYRAAVLKAAVEGKLTETWRAEHPATEPASILLERILKERRARWEANLRAKGKDPAKVKYIEPAKPDTESLPELPEGWCWATVEQVGDVQLGRQRAPQHHTGPYMRPYLRVANVFEDRIDTSDILTMNFTPEEYEIYCLKFGDILLNEGQSLELIGRPAMYRDEVPGTCFQNTLVRFRAYPSLIAKYALILFRAYLRSQRFQRIGKHTTNIAHLGAGRFAVLEFPLPPAFEQEQIVAEVEQRLSVVTQLEAIIQTNLKRAERLRQSLLKEAFAGRLVPQDPDDEPASVLLERIRKERDRRKKETASNGRYVHVPDEPVQKIHMEETQQVGLWESVGG